MNNSKWAHSLIDQLIQQGAVNFCIAPGSRSTPLALAAARHPKAKITVHFDERGLGFYALGLSQARQFPSVLIVTSGTAVGNLLPAVMEACHSHIPLIVLTADRPPELRSCGANQATDQIKIFQNFTLWQADLPCPDPNIPEEYIRSEAAQAVFQALRMGPVHLNCQFREPLFEEPSPKTEGKRQWHADLHLTLDPAVQKQCHEMIKMHRRGLLLVGRLAPGTPIFPFFRLAKRLGWPIFADLLSQVRCEKPPNEVIEHFDHIIRAKAAPIPDFILHCGGAFTSKALNEWVHTLNIPTLHVSSWIERIDPLHNRPARVCADPAQFCEQIEIDRAPDNQWLRQWQPIDRRMKNVIDASFDSAHPLTEADMMRSIGEQLPDDWTVFLANSMPIRDAEHFLFPRKASHFFANRGLAGIDGQIATAAGIAAHLKKPMVAIIGDQSCLHDLNSFALLRHLSSPFILIVLNNFGGGIFSRLPVAREQEHFETLFGAGHSYRFEKIAQMFDLPYQSIEQTLRVDFSRTVIVEIFTSRKENVSFEKQILENCSKSKESADCFVKS